jgi:hypothetical protein
MIRFSQFLQENEKKKAEADKKQTEEKNVSFNVIS